MIIICVFSVFTARLAYLQIIKGFYYWNEAEENRIQYFYIMAPRGNIYDRNGEKLVGNQPTYSLFISPEKISVEEKKKIAQKISLLTGRAQDKIYDKFNTDEIKPFGAIDLVSYLSKEEIMAIEENLHYLPQVSIQMESRRKYPFEENGSHLLGHIGEINREELARLNKQGYKLKDKIGKSGLEKAYDAYLRGADGLQEIEVGVKGGHRKVLRTYPAQIGNDILLTIDWKLQEAAYRAMEGKKGAVVAMDPSTGEILVWISKPGFNPEYFTLPLTTDRAKEMFDNPEHPLFDRVIQGQYAPGSLFKVAVALAALEQDPEAVHREYECRGFIQIGYDRKIYKCWKDKKHGKLELEDAIANSCNVYFYQLGMDTGPESIYKTALELGFGSPSVPFFNNEKTGLMPDPRWKKKIFGLNWYPGDTANMSVGQGYVLANPFQILSMVSAVAMRGKVYKPYVIKMVISPEGRVTQKFEPVYVKNLQFSDRNIDIVREAMKKVTEYGTAQYLNLPLEVASKTGTAENPSGEDHAWYACFAPFDDPKIAIVVLVENGGYGSVAALPVARQILKEKFAIK